MITLPVENWIAFGLAARSLNMSVGAAETTLRKLCASGNVRSQKAIFRIDGAQAIQEEDWRRVSPDEWRDHPVDMEELGADGYEMLIQICEDDLRYWLEEERALSPDAKSSPLDQAILKAFEAGKSPPENVTWPAFADCVRDVADAWIDKKAGKYKRGFETKTIERHARVLKNR
jgi:hypothetical protein